MMKTLLSRIRKPYSVQRKILLHRHGVSYSSHIFKKVKNKWVFEQVLKGKIKKSTNRFPLIFATRFYSVLPLEDAQSLEFATTLQNKKQVLKTIPFELANELPYSAEELVFDARFLRQKKEKMVWRIVFAPVQNIDREILYWHKMGISLDGLIWEGDLQADFMRYSFKNNGTQAVAIEKTGATHLMWQKNESDQGENLFLDPQPEIRNKKIQRQLRQKNINSLNKVSSKNLAVVLEQGFVQAVNAGTEMLNLLSFQTQKKWGKLFFREKIPALAGLLLVLSLAVTLSQAGKVWNINRKIKYLAKQKRESIEQISRKTGLSESEIMSRPLISFVSPDRDSVLKTFMVASDILSRTTSTSYLGKSLEINPERFILAGETSSFTEVENLERELARSEDLSNVVVLKREKTGPKVMFQLQADRSFK